MSIICCINNNDITKNDNYTRTLGNASSEKNSSIIKSEKEKLPISQIKYTPEIEEDLPITSKTIIIKKEGSPLVDYEIISHLGEGTYGKVYKVKNKHNNLYRAMKQININYISERVRNKIMEEIEILKELNYIYIIKLYEYYVTKEHIYLLSELSNEGDLQKKLDNLKVFPEFFVKIIMFQIFKALRFLNEKNIIHGDLKLENILLINYNEDINTNKKNKNKNKKEDGFIEAIKHDMKIINEKKDKNNSNIDLNQLQINNYGIKLIDFGCSKIFTRTKKNFSDIIGTLVYSSPEVLYGEYNKLCDIWSCGVIMYYLLSGYFPFEGETEEEIKSKIYESKYNFDEKYFNNISEEGKDLISKCLKNEPKQRITIEEALNHKFFDEIKVGRKITDIEKKQLTKLKKLRKKTKFYQLILTYLSYHFSDNKLLNEINQLYEKLDKNMDFQISQSEIYKAYKEAKIVIKSKEVENIINSMDFNDNGDIDYEEFVRMCIPKEKLFTEKNLENAFLMFDNEKKGFITPHKIIDFIESSQKINEELKSQIENEIIDLADEIIDLDGFKEFILDLSK